MGVPPVGETGKLPVPPICQVTLNEAVRYCAGVMRSTPFMYLRSAVGIVTLPSAF